MKKSLIEIIIFSFIWIFYMINVKNFTSSDKAEIIAYGIGCFALIIFASLDIFILFKKAKKNK